MLRAVLARILSTSDVDTVEAMVSRVRRALDADFAQVVVRRLEAASRAASAHITGVEGPRKETATREMRTAFAVYVNVLSTAVDYAERITRELGSEPYLAQFYDAGSEGEGAGPGAGAELREVTLVLQSLDGATAQLRSVLRTELDHLFAQLTRPRLRPLLSEAYRDVTYVLDEERYMEAEAADLVQRRFIKGWDQILQVYREVLNESNFALYHSLAIDQIVRPWENLILGSSSSGGGGSGAGASGRGAGAQGAGGSMRFTELGALRFDKDLRNISNYVAGQTNLGVREKFIRLQQMSYILNLDPVSPRFCHALSSLSSLFSWEQDGQRRCSHLTTTSAPFSPLNLTTRDAHGPPSRRRRRAPSRRPPALG